MKLNFVQTLALASALSSGVAMAAPAKPAAPMMKKPSTTMAKKPMMKSSSMKSSSMMKTSAADQKYLKEDAQGSIYDQATAKLAVQKAKSPAVHAYAVMLTKDHARINSQMLAFARSRKMVVPVAMMSSDKTKLGALKSKSGAAFDKAYLQEAVKINSDDVKKGTKELASTKDAGVKKLVGGFVATEKKTSVQRAEFARQNEVKICPQTTKPPRKRRLCRLSRQDYWAATTSAVSRATSAA